MRSMPRCISTIYAKYEIDNQHSDNWRLNLINYYITSKNVKNTVELGDWKILKQKWNKRNLQNIYKNNSQGV